MKKAIFIIILLLVITKLNAQSDEKNAFYLTSEYKFGNYKGINLNLNYVFTSNYSVQFGYSWFVRDAKSRPEDYTSGLFKIFTLGLSDLHFDTMENFQFMVGKIVSLNENGNIRVHMSGGFGITTIIEPTNWRPISNFTWGENYTYDMDKHNTISLIINPKFEFPFTRIFGLTISPMLQINKDRTFIGVGMGTMIGLLRKEKTN